MTNGPLLALNPVWWLQVRLLGGSGRVISIGAVYLSLLIAGIVGFRYFDRSPPTAAYCDGVIWVLSFVQALVMIFGGCNAVFRALARDVNTKMLESHRLTPLSSAAVMSGYVIGANVQVLTLYVIGLVVGAVVIQWGTIGMAGWLVGNLELLVIAPLAWTVTLALGMGRDKPVNPGTFLFIVLILWAPLLYLPGAGLLSGVYGGYIAVTTMAGSNDVSGALAAIPAFVALSMTVIWARGAMRKFRRPDLPAFGPLRALGLLVIWLAVGSAGLLLAGEVARQDIAGLGLQSSPISDPEYVPACLTATAGIAMLIALFPLNASTSARIRRLRGASPVRPGDTYATVGMPVLCTILIIAFLLPLHDAVPWKLVAPVGAAMWASLLLFEGLLTAARARGWKAGRLVGAYVVLFWGGPPLLDSWIGELTAARSASYAAPDPPSALIGFSPIGSIARLFLKDVHVNLLPGVCFQVALGLIVWFVGRRALRRLRIRSA